ncbi:Hypothetical predicted protein, partial [Mytilus galloprovincialis]
QSAISRSQLRLELSVLLPKNQKVRADKIQNNSFMVDHKEYRSLKYTNIPTEKCNFSDKTCWYKHDKGLVRLKFLVKDPYICHGDT